MSAYLLVVAAGLALVAVLYSSVGHGGASGYLAVLALAGFAPEELRPTALVLNVIVASVATWRFAPYFTWRLFWPFAIASIPCAFIAGKWIHLEANVYNVILGLVLLYAALRLLLQRRRNSDAEVKPPIAAIAILAGAIIGLISGTMGVGGGIFLSPLIVLAGWASPRQTASVAAAFILVNSLAALGGLSLHLGGPPIEIAHMAIFGISVLAAGLVGSGLGSSRAKESVLNRLLAAVLVIASAKMILTVLS